MPLSVVHHIETLIEEKAEKMSEDFLDELEVRGITSPEDYLGGAKIIEETLISYQAKFLSWLSKQ